MAGFSAPPAKPEQQSYEVSSFSVSFKVFFCHFGKGGVSRCQPLSNPRKPMEKRVDDACPSESWTHHHSRAEIQDSQLGVPSTAGAISGLGDWGWAFCGPRPLGEWLSLL